MFEEFDSTFVDVPGARIFTRTAGEGPPLLLLHGWPQTHAIWHEIAPALTNQYRVTIADLRGYGESIAHDGDFTFRAMAHDMVNVMKYLEAPTFHLVGHDRGARTAHRMCLDFPDSIQSVALLDILPTVKVWELMNAWLAQRYYHWVFLAQPAPMPQDLISANPVNYLHAALGGLSGPLDIFNPEALQAYERAAKNPEVVAAWCADYAAAADVDLDHDRADLGRSLDIPALVLWGSKGVVGAQADPLEVWREWFPHVTGHPIDAGHFLVEEQSQVVLDAIRHHLRTLHSGQHG